MDRISAAELLPVAPALITLTIFSRGGSGRKSATITGEYCLSCAEFVPTSSCDRAVVHPVSCPIGWVTHPERNCGAIFRWRALSRSCPRVSGSAQHQALSLMTWARGAVEHGTITGRGGDKFGARKAVFACNGCAFSPRPPREKIDPLRILA